MFLFFIFFMENGANEEADHLMSMDVRKVAVIMNALPPFKVGIENEVRKVFCIVIILGPSAEL